MRIRLIQPWSGMPVGRETEVPDSLAKRLAEQRIANAIEVRRPPAAPGPAVPEAAPSPPAAGGGGASRGRRGRARRGGPR